MKKVSLLSLFIMIITLCSAVQPSSAASFESDFNNQKILFLGDSITEGSGASSLEKSFPELLVNRLGFEDYGNYGDGGSNITSHADRTDSFVDRVITMEAEADIVIIEGGINDYKYPMEIGVDPASTTTTELYGALNYVFDAVNTKYPDALVIVLTPMQSVLPSGATTAANSLGYTLEDYRDAIVARADAYKFHTIDLYNIVGYNAATNNVDRLKYTDDGYHPNDLGHERIANILCSFLDGENLATDVEYNSGGYLYGDTLNTSSDTFFYTTLIPVKPGYTYSFLSQKASGGNLLQPGQFYSYDMSYNSDIPSANQVNNIVTIPNDVYYMAVNVVDGNQDNFTLYEIQNYDLASITYETFGGSTYSQESVEVGTYISEPNAPTRDGSTFLGWCIDEDLEVPFDFETDTVTSDITLYAKWASTPSNTTSSLSGNGTLTEVNGEPLELFGITWYWYAVVGVGAFWLFGTKGGKKFRKNLGK